MIVKLGDQWLISRVGALVALKLVGTGRLAPVYRGRLRFERGGILLHA